MNGSTVYECELSTDPRFFWKTSEDIWVEVPSPVWPQWLNGNSFRVFNKMFESFEHI